MAQPLQQRVSVVRGQHVVPLVPGAPHGVDMPSPWKGIVVERHTVPTMEIPLHEHHSFCLHAQLSGTPEMEWWCDGRNAVEHPRPGALILLAPGTRDRLRWQGTSERLIVSVEERFLQRAAEDAGAAKPPEFTNQWLLHDASLQSLLMEMNREREAGWPAGSLYGDLLGLSLAQTLLRRHAADAMPITPAHGGMPLPRLRRVLEFVTANLHTDLRLEQLAAEAGMSTFHFARLFRAGTGRTPHQHVLEERIERAMHLMQLRNLTIQQIAEETGFRSASNLTRSFHARVGVTPGEWLRRS